MEALKWRRSGREQAVKRLMWLYGGYDEELPPAVMDSRPQTIGHNLPLSAPFIMLLNRGQEALRIIFLCILRLRFTALSSGVGGRGVSRFQVSVRPSWSQYCRHCNP